MDSVGDCFVLESGLQFHPKLVQELAQTGMRISHTATVLSALCSSILEDVEEECDVPQRHHVNYGRRDADDLQNSHWYAMSIRCFKYPII